jgi:hypothetical protein
MGGSGGGIDLPLSALDGEGAGGVETRFLTTLGQTDYIKTTVEVCLPLLAEGMAVQWLKVARHGRDPIPHRR